MPLSGFAPDWTGFYVGLHAGGEFGTTKNIDLDSWNAPNAAWKYNHDGFAGGGQLGYNFQWKRLVAGSEADLGYMNVSGSGAYPGSVDTIGHDESDFYTTLRARVGMALNRRWLVYATCGAIALNFHSSVNDDSLTPGGGLVDTSKRSFNWGYAAGGGVEYAMDRHWSVKMEYLYFNLDKQVSSGISSTGAPLRYRFANETSGHLLRLGVNYRF